MAVSGTVFLYGTLRAASVRAAVLGDVATEPAVLPDHRIIAGHDDGAPFPAAAPGARAEGVLAHLDEEQLARLDAYEGLFGYRRQTVTVLRDGRRVTADAWFPDAPPGDAAPWDFDAWAEREAGREALFAAEAVHEIAALGPARARRRLGPIAARAEARHLAGGPRPATRRRRPADGDVITRERALGYANFLAVEDYRLNHRRFDGTMSPELARACLVSADAVTVLPYDPARGRVMLIEQFRIGPHARGDATAWTLEAIAGRVDGGETPEQAARREAEEEARLALGRLIALPGFYTTPGMASEFIHPFLAFADLPDAAAGLAGAEAEGEDIRSHLMMLDEALDLVSTGEVDNGPAILSLLWLARRRAALDGAIG